MRGHAFWREQEVEKDEPFAQGAHATNLPIEGDDFVLLGRCWIHL